MEDVFFDATPPADFAAFAQSLPVPDGWTLEVSQVFSNHDRSRYAVRVSASAAASLFVPGRDGKAIAEGLRSSISQWASERGVRFYLKPFPLGALRNEDFKTRNPFHICT